MKEIGGIKTIVVKEGKEEEFLKLFFEMLERIRKEHKEHSDTVYYDLYRSRSVPRGFVVLERYVDEASWQSHQDAEYGKIYFPKIRALLESIEVEYFDAVQEQ